MECLDGSYSISECGCLINTAGWGRLNGWPRTVQDQGTIPPSDTHFLWLWLSLFCLVVASLPFQRVWRITTRKLPSSFCLPAGVDAIYCSIKFIQRISLESQEVPEDIKPFKSQIFTFQLQNYWRLWVTGWQGRKGCKFKWDEAYSATLWLLLGIQNTYKAAGIGKGRC